MVEFRQICHVVLRLKALNVLNDFCWENFYNTKIFFYPDIVVQLWMCYDKCVRSFPIVIINQVIIKLSSLEFNGLFVILNQRHIQIKNVVLRIVEQKENLICFWQLLLREHQGNSHFPCVIRSIIKTVWSRKVLAHRGVDVQRLPAVYLVYWR